MHIAIIETTVNIPHNLVALAENAREHGHDVSFIIIGDLKTPPEAAGVCERLKGIGYPAQYWSAEEQRTLAKSYPFLKRVPYSSGLRRNIGSFLAYRKGVDAVLFVDDDNWPAPGTDFLAFAMGKTRIRPLAAGGWVNPLYYAKTSTSLYLYARGFPLSRRFGKESMPRASSGPVNIAVHQGLFLGVPDVDAFVHLTIGVKVLEVGTHSGYSRGAYFPVNTQYTAVSRELLPAFYLPDLGRNFDIIAGYFLQRVCYSMGRAASFGPPALIHRRNSHNYLADLESELPGLKLIDEMVPILERPATPQTSVSDACEAVLKDFKDVFPPEAIRGYHEWFEGMLSVA